MPDYPTHVLNQAQDVAEFLLANPQVAKELRNHLPESECKQLIAHLSFKPLPYNSAEYQGLLS